MQLWLKDTLASLPPHHARIVRPFAEWGVLRAARRRADKDRYTLGSARSDQRSIRAAIRFMTCCCPSPRPPTPSSPAAW
ncbi:MULTISPECIES: hypothetical protein [unclassified Streptomyces]|uniref:hypothetical protein n=1 Tax=unclassified Streptomyces TaxID=2593676 RepID=UPI002E78B9E0|nr:hypothetical protein [Streptomyces sp. JV184]MEE1742960.1 hypothetical protein [Streptomyces sp. JV184]